MTKKWRLSKDPLFRGDSKDGVQTPDPSANDAIVRHVLYFEGPGRATPYLSTSEQAEFAENFAQAGLVWQTYVKVAETEGVKHISNSELLGFLKGEGKGKARWSERFEVMQARRYVEQWGEHLLDFRFVSEPALVVKKIFKKQ